MHILVTGAGGYIGSITTDYLLQQGHTVVGVDNFLTGFRRPLEEIQRVYTKQFKWYICDLQNAAEVESIFAQSAPFNCVIHCAASCIVRESSENPGKYFRNNIAPVLNVLDAMRNHDCKAIIFSSTAAVYGEVPPMPILETQPTQPINVYGLSKHMAEDVIKSYGKYHGIQYGIFRYFNVYGANANGSLGYAKKPCTHLVDALAQHVILDMPFILTCGTNHPTVDGTPVRDYIHVLDLARAHTLGAEYIQKHTSFVCNLGTKSGDTTLQIVAAVRALTHKNIPIQEGEPRKDEDPFLVADNTYARTLLGWSPTLTLETAWPNIVRWYTGHPRGWEY